MQLSKQLDCDDTGTAGLFALDTETGETKWHRDGNRPVYADDHLYVATETEPRRSTRRAE
ncbi:hypothetical protein ACFFQF_09225 [Haladaptatus pallidirubidus]|uniref:PQQ-like domain-containing protein n=1 Tax=Haladaptatus pallidirubidus TaxID=1008152 RepID=A0AAV3UG38_9EURY|nr:hypothetical protein [Haladaptatus pallidirubidus]